MAELLDLGNGHRLRFVEDGRGSRIGAIHEHPYPTGTYRHGYCAGMVWFDVPATYVVEQRDRVHAKWQIIQESPLTLTPSIRCGDCGLHGFVRDGKWVNA